MTMGIQAHIQHLKGHVSTIRPQIIVDPHYNVLVTSGILGTVTTLDELYAAWAPQSYTYGISINGILRDLSLFPSR
jgi:hypothetical protein